MGEIMGAKDFGLPPEITDIKQYVERHLNARVGVEIKPRTIIITTSSSSLAGALRPHLYRLAKSLKTQKKLVIRIG